MLKNKSLVIMSILVLVLAVVAMACAPATPPKPVVTPPVVTPPVVTPPAPTANATTSVTPTPAAPPAIVEKVTTYKSVKYADPKYKFSVAYPEGWTSAPATLTGGVFYAKGEGKDVVYIAVRPATNFKAAANTFMTDLIAASGMSVTPSVDSETTITLADGTKADVILLSAAFGLAKAAITGVIKDGNAIMVMGGTDPKNMDLYKEIGSALITK